MPHSVVCPSCNTALTVSDAAPVRLTCPWCLARIENRAAPSQARTVAVPVIPIENQVALDSRIGRWAVMAMIVLVCVGVFVIASGGGSDGILVVLVVLILVASVIAVLAKGQRAAGPYEMEPVPSSIRPSDGTSSVLNYARPMRRKRSPAASLGLFVGGMLVGVGAAWVALSAQMPPQVSLLGPPSVGFALLFVRNSRTFGAGLLLALPLGALILIGLCFASAKF